MILKSSSPQEQTNGVCEEVMGDEGLQDLGVVFRIGSASSIVRGGRGGGVGFTHRV